MKLVDTHGAHADRLDRPGHPCDRNASRWSSWPCDAIGGLRRSVVPACGADGWRRTWHSVDGASRCSAGTRPARARPLDRAAQTFRVRRESWPLRCAAHSMDSLTTVPAQPLCGGGPLCGPRAQSGARGKGDAASHHCQGRGRAAIARRTHIARQLKAVTGSAAPAPPRSRNSLSARSNWPLTRTWTRTVTSAAGVLLPRNDATAPHKCQAAP